VAWRTQLANALMSIYDAALSPEHLVAALDSVSREIGAAGSLLVREVISHSPFDEETRERLLNVFDQLQLEYGIDEDTGAKVAERSL